MAKRKPKPAPQDATAPVANEFPSDATSHAVAANVTDPAAFEFPFGAASEAVPPVAEARRNPSPATDTPAAPARSHRESVDADGRYTYTVDALGDRVFPASALPAKPPAGNAEPSREAGGEGKAWNPVFGLRGDHEAGVRLLEDRRFKQMRIQFDAKPTDAVREAMRDGGYQWRQAEQVWTKRIDPERAWQTRAEAETLFAKVTALVREERGLAPAQGTGHQPD